VGGVVVRGAVGVSFCCFVFCSLCVVVLPSLWRGVKSVSSSKAVGPLAWR